MLQSHCRLSPLVAGHNGGDSATPDGSLYPGMVSRTASVTRLTHAGTIPRSSLPRAPPEIKIPNVTRITRFTSLGGQPSHRCSGPRRGGGSFGFWEAQQEGGIKRPRSHNLNWACQEGRLFHLRPNPSTLSQWVGRDRI